MFERRSVLRGFFRCVSVKIAIIGATSQSTPALFRALAASPAAREMEFALAARNPARLKSIGRAIGLVSAFSPSLHDYSPPGLTTAIADASAILIQIRYGGLAGREFDESFPVGFGICGDEGLGPGGLSSAWRTWPQLNELLGLVERVTTRAEVLLLTSPTGLLTRLAAIARPALRIHAICELPWTTVRAAKLADYDYFGINHLGWIYGGCDPLPLKYWRLHFDRETVLATQRTQRENRASELLRLTARAMGAYASGSLREVEAAIASRDAPWYSDAIAPWLESLVTGESHVHFFFSVRNEARYPEFAADDIFEMAHTRNRGETLRRPHRNAPPQDLIDLLRPFVHYERQAARAILTRDADAITRALALHPWVHPRDANPLAGAVVTQRFAAQAAMA